MIHFPTATSNASIWNRMSSDRSRFLLEVPFTLRNILLCQTKFMAIVSPVLCTRNANVKNFWRSRNKLCNVCKYEMISEHHLGHFALTEGGCWGSEFTYINIFVKLHVVDCSHTHQSHMHTHATRVMRNEGF